MHRRPAPAGAPTPAGAGPASMSETEAAFVEWARQQALGLGLLATHRRDSRRDAGWSRGFPDLVVASRTGHGILVVETKTSGGNLSREQQIWRRAFEANTAPPVWLLARPADREGLRVRFQMLTDAAHGGTPA